MHRHAHAHARAHATRMHMDTYTHMHMHTRAQARTHACAHEHACLLATFLSLVLLGTTHWLLTIALCYFGTLENAFSGLDQQAR